MTEWIRGRGIFICIGERQGIIRWGASMAWDKIFSGRGVSAPSQEARSEELNSTSSSTESNLRETRRDTRRSKRVYIAAPVIVTGEQGKETFEERAFTESVNAHGCLIRLIKPVDHGQKLTLIGLKSRESIECRVAYVGQAENGKTQAGIEFLRPAAYFWHIAFPPDDWNSAERKKPTVETGATGRRA